MATDDRDERLWRRPTEYARTAGISRRLVWTWVAKGALEVSRVKPHAASKRAAGVRVRDRRP